MSMTSFIVTGESYGILSCGVCVKADFVCYTSMPLLQTKIEGKGNGIKTVIPNMADIARALSRPATCKYNMQDLVNLG